MPTCAVAFILMGLGLAPHFAQPGVTPAAFASLTPLTVSIIYHTILTAILIIFSLACIRYGHLAEAYFGKKDPGSVCADETAGQAIPLMFLPSTLPAWTALKLDPRIDHWLQAAILCAIAFLAFRIFDIIKLPPARNLQRLTGGWGILVDDLVAGVQAMVGVQILLRMVG
jgi:phosphatidylglycerophosphatase A